jgi:hypothetical protein
MIAIAVAGITGLLAIGLLVVLKPIWVEIYCQNEAKKIVGGQWDKLYPAEGSETQYVSQITWGYREQLKCEKKFR